MALTEEMIIEQNFQLIEPDILALTDDYYQEKYSSQLNKNEVLTMSEILIYPLDEIFSDDNYLKILTYGDLEFRDKKIPVVSQNVKDLLIEIDSKRFDKNAVIHDLSKKLDEHVNGERTVFLESTNFLIQEGYLNLE